MAIRQRFAVTLLSACALAVTTPAMASPFNTGAQAAPLLSAAEAFTPISAVWRNGEVELGIRMAPGYYLYRHTMHVDAPPLQPVLQLPGGTTYYDDFFGDVLIYRDWVSARFAAEQVPTTVTLRYQGCADVGVCYPPQTTTLSVVKARQ